MKSKLIDIQPLLIPHLPNSDKYLIWHIQGGLGKHIAATSLLKDLSFKYSDRKIILVVAYPELFIFNPFIYRVYSHNSISYFYDDYIKDKDTLVFMHEPYHQTGHINKQKHLIENWCDLLDIEYTSQVPDIHVNMAQRLSTNSWIREKPIMVIQTNGGDLNDSKPYSWTRDIPIEIATQLSHYFAQDYHIIQICKTNSQKIPGAEIVDYSLSNTELIALLINSTKRLLIDSCLQHAAAAFNLSSTVLWVGTSPKVFGYPLHANIQAFPPKHNIKLINSYLFDYSFDGIPHECPYNLVDEMFDPSAIIRALN
jgi:hypothetical protein